MTAPKANVISDITVWYLRDEESSSPTITDERLKELIRAAATSSPAAVNVNVVSQSASFVDSFWEPTKGDFHTAVHDKVPFYHRFDTFVVVVDATANTNNNKTTSSSVAAIADGDVMYALYEKRVPVLRIDVTTTDGSAENSGDASPSTNPSSSSASSSGTLRKHKMLTNVSANSTSTAEAAITEFFTFPAHQGRVIVVEGGDGAGKQTQVKLLFDRLHAEGYKAETLDYPHDAAGYGVMIRELLSGKMGNIKEVNPLIFATLYGLNRHSTLPLLKYWVQKGANIVLDRYMTANFGHQASKYEKDEDRINAIKTLQTFELKWLNLPDADKVFYLNLPPDFAFKAMQQDTTRRELDMHELAGIEYKNNVRKSFLWCCETFNSTWKEIRCVNESETERFSREAVHEAIYSNVEALLVNKKKE